MNFTILLCVILNLFYPIFVPLLAPNLGDATVRGSVTAKLLKYDGCRNVGVEQHPNRKCYSRVDENTSERQILLILASSRLGHVTWWSLRDISAAEA